MNWADVLPPQVAKAQASWDRGSQVLRLRECGVTLEKIGVFLGLSKERIRQMEFKARRQRAKNIRSPLEVYLDGNRDVGALVGLVRTRRNAC